MDLPFVARPPRNDVEQQTQACILLSQRLKEAAFRGNDEAVNMLKKNLEIARRNLRREVSKWIAAYPGKG